ncbi:hypothetical protein J6590_107830, partial [Homalodisca vitripennis]
CPCLPNMHVTTSGSQSKAVSDPPAEQDISLQKLGCKLRTSVLSCYMEQHCRLQVVQDLANYTSSE